MTYKVHVIDGKAYLPNTFTPTNGGYCTRCALYYNANTPLACNFVNSSKGNGRMCGSKDNVHYQLESPESLANYVMAKLMGRLEHGQTS